MKKLIVGILIAIAAFFGGNQAGDFIAGGQIGASPIEHRIGTVSSASFDDLASTSFTLVDDPGDSCAIEVVSVTGKRNFSGAVWDMNRTNDFGIGVGYNDDVDIVASFSRGFVSGNYTSSTASPQYEVKFPANHVASPSEAILLKRNSQLTAPFTTGDTSFKVDLAYRKICN